MKNNKFFLFLILIIFAFNTFFFLLILKSNKNKANIINKKMPSLYTEGKYIKRADNNKTIQLKGVSTMAFARYNHNIEKFISILEVVKGWNINFLGLYINPNNLVEDKLDTVINWAEKNYIYVYLMPTLDSDYELEVRSTIKKFPELIKKLAKKYQEKNHILYGLWAEPRYFSPEEWEEYFDNGIRLIREVNPKTIILISGLDYSRVFPKDSKILRFKNIILDFHDYPAANIEELRPILKQKLYFNWQNYYENYPILIGEFSGVYSDGFSSVVDLEYIKKVLIEVDKNLLNYTAYVLDEEKGTSLINWETKLPTKRGEIIKNNLLK